MKTTLRSSMLFLAALTAAQPSLAASTFSEVRSVLLDQRAQPQTQAEQEDLDVYRNGQLPHYEVSASTFVVNGINVLAERARRTTSENVDYYPRLTKLVHPNGICFTGEWTITEPSSYTGYFAQGSRGLFVGRASVAMTETESGHKRGFGFAGKIFPTTDTEASVETASFFTVDVLMGTKRPTFVGTALTNEPALGFDWHPSVLWLGKKIADVFTKADGNPGFRPLYPISRLGLAPGQKAKTPHWMKITTAAGTAIVGEADFRRELDIARYHHGSLRLDVYASDTTKDASATQGWKRLGQIELKESMVSYGCDRQLHFGHPKLNDPQGAN